MVTKITPKQSKRINALIKMLCCMVGRLPPTYSKEDCHSPLENSNLLLYPFSVISECIWQTLPKSLAASQNISKILWLIQFRNNFVEFKCRISCFTGVYNKIPITINVLKP